MSRDRDVFATCDFRFVRRDGLSLNWSYPDMALLDALAVVAGVKPLSLINLPLTDRKYVLSCRRLASFFGLQFQFIPPAGGRKVGRLYFAKTTALIDKASRLMDVNPDDPRLIALLGYPACCVRFFERFRKGRSEADIIGAIDASTASRGKLSFTVNNLFNLAGRVNSPTSPLKTLAKVHLLPWHPCRFDCKASLAAGRTLEIFIHAIAPDLARVLRDALSNVVLYFNDGECAVLKGRKAGRARCLYTSLRSPANLRDGGLRASLRTADEIVVEKNRIRVLKKGREKAVVDCRKPLLLDFTGD